MNRLAATHCLILVSVLMSATHGKPRQVRSTSEEPEYVTVTTQYGDIRGRNYNLSDSLDLNVFLGVPYAKPPVGELRLARPQPIESWSPDVHNATVHGAKCVQRVIASDPVLADVPFSEDCLFIDIYATRSVQPWTSISETTDQIAPSPDFS
ncbi:hypothetical protein RRG08_000365 [Elysia crispata]|uniref:Carboxylesterase type B domain-containing protein n=1 Tax=Elysia crispata TaxID=231223 RepID=A0AAE1CUZ8_9GAST|nr:hypothetical protein RRG08_000365 [Elysia crispata]